MVSSSIDSGLKLECWGNNWTWQDCIGEPISQGSNLGTVSLVPLPKNKIRLSWFAGEIHKPQRNKENKITPTKKPYKDSVKQSSPSPIQKANGSRHESKNIKNMTAQVDEQT